METIAITLFIIACGSWMGAILFHSAVVAPTTFTRLPAEHAGTFLRGLFPRFFVFGLICGGVMLAAVVALAALQQGRDWLLTGTLIMVVLEAVSLAMVPAINRARDEERKQAFGRLHGINVLLTLAILAIGLTLLWVVAAS
ncbi:MAG: DUF4149 domain-containing protein [Pseudomonadota bacterium]